MDSASNSLSPTSPEPVCHGTLHILVAYDWGDEINLEAARLLVPAEYHALPRRSRTPVSISYQTAPLRLNLPAAAINLPVLGTVAVVADLIVFDFGAVSLRLQVPFERSAADLTRLAGELAEPASVIDDARPLLTPVFEQLQPAIDAPLWAELSEEYFVFQLVPDLPLPAPDRLLAQQADWLASLVRLEDLALSNTEVAEALRLRISYSPCDLVITDWAAAVVVDRDCDEVIETIAFANLQLLEFRHIDARLDDRLKSAYGMIRKLGRTRLPLWRGYWRPLRELGELKVESNEMFERASSALTLVGDPYVARVYQQLAARFHLDEWGRNIRRAIDVLEGTYQVVSDQVTTRRGEFLEIVVVILILIEVLLGLWRH